MARLRAKQPDDLVRVYSFQSIAARDAAEAKGFWAGDAAFIDPDFRTPYAWMIEQMQIRIPGFSGDYPIWAYLRRPNMRQRRYDEDAVLVVADVPRKRMLLSDYDGWHNPLYFWYWASTQEEMDRLEAAGLQTFGCERDITPEMKKSWEAIFDLSERTDPDVIAYNGRLDTVQATIDRIYTHEIVRITRALGRIGRNGGTVY
jgi:hypothetical protein